MVKGEVDVAGGGRMTMVAVGLVADIKKCRGDKLRNMCWWRVGSPRFQLVTNWVLPRTSYTTSSRLLLFYG